MKYPIFSFDKFEYRYENNSLIINFYYSCSEYNFIHELKINNCPQKSENLEFFIYNIGLSLIPSYWKLFCSPTIQLPNHLADEQLSFWHKLFINGMGEYYYKNKIDFTKPDFLKIEIVNKKLELNKNLKFVNKNSGTVLVPVGGGKDSIVTLELLKQNYAVTAFVINPVPLINEVIKIANVSSISVENIFDPELFDLNKQGFLNGHVPISAFYAFCSLLTAYLLDIPYVAFSNERSSSEGNTTYLDQEINHQYSKTLEFETDLNRLITSSLNNSIHYFSFLRPLYELQITKLFSNYPQYFNTFSSCNQNFKQNSSQKNLWCLKCPKCVSTSPMLSQFIGKNKVIEIMNGFPNQPEILDQLTGKSPVKPFECVLTRSEALACTSGQGLAEILNSWQDNPNMPEEFSKILQNAINS